MRRAATAVVDATALAARRSRPQRLASNNSPQRTTTAEASAAPTCASIIATSAPQGEAAATSASGPLMWCPAGIPGDPIPGIEPAPSVTAPIDAW